MNPKSFVKLYYKNNIAASADGFLAAHKNWLETGEISAKASPILVEIANGKVSAKNGLQAIASIAYQYVIDAASVQAEKALTKKPGTRSSGANKSYTGVITDKDGEIVIVDDKPLRVSFDHPQDAERWCQRKLFDGSNDWSGSVIWNHDGSVIADISRDEAMYALRKINKSPYMHKNTYSGSTRKQKMRVSPTIQHFSHG